MFNRPIILNILNMQRLKLYPVFFSAIFLFTACSGASGGNSSGKDSSGAAPATAAGSSASPDASKVLPFHKTLCSEQSCCLHY
jgi:hypothetical protein